MPGTSSTYAGPQFFNERADGKPPQQWHRHPKTFLFPFLRSSAIHYHCTTTFYYHSSSEYDFLSIHSRVKSQLFQLCLGLLGQRPRPTMAVCRIQERQRSEARTSFLSLPNTLFLLAKSHRLAFGLSPDFPVPSIRAGLLVPQRGLLNRPRLVDAFIHPSSGSTIPNPNLPQKHPVESQGSFLSRVESREHGHFVPLSLSEQMIVESLASRRVNAFAVCSHGMCIQHQE